MSNFLIEEAQQLEPGTGPWKVFIGEYDGEDWLVATFGQTPEGKTVHVTTDHVHASETNGATADEDAAWLVWCRNHWGSILEALAETGSPIGTDAEKIEARRQLEAWNRGEPIRALVPDAEIMVFALQSQEAAAERER